MTVEYGVEYTADPGPFVAAGYTRDAARHAVQLARAAADGPARDRYRPEAARVVRRDVGPWHACPEDQPTTVTEETGQ